MIIMMIITLVQEEKLILAIMYGSVQDVQYFLMLKSGKVQLLHAVLL